MEKQNKRKSNITTNIKVEDGPYIIYGDSLGMQLAFNTPPSKIPHGDVQRYISLLEFAQSEWERAKQIEKEANTVKEPPIIT